MKEMMLLSVYGVYYFCYYVNEWCKKEEPKKLDESETGCLRFKNIFTLQGGWGEGL